MRSELLDDSAPIVFHLLFEIAKSHSRNPDWYPAVFVGIATLSAAIEFGTVHVITPTDATGLENQLSISMLVAKPLRGKALVVFCRKVPDSRRVSLLILAWFSLSRALAVHNFRRVLKGNGSRKIPVSPKGGFHFLQKRGFLKGVSSFSKKRLPRCQAKTSLNRIKCSGPPLQTSDRSEPYIKPSQTRLRPWR